jgi:hypothetical protein
MDIAHPGKRGINGFAPARDEGTGLGNLLQMQPLSEQRAFG